MNAKRILFILTFLMMQLFSVGQSYKKSSKFSRINDGSEYLQSAKAISDVNPAEAIDLIQKSLQLSIPAKNYQVEGESYQLLGNINANNKQYDLAINYYEKAVLAFESGNNQNKLNGVLKELATTLRLAKKFDKALAVVNRFEENINKKTNNVADQIWVNENRALIYKQQGKLDEALVELNTAENLANSVPRYKNKSAEIKNVRGDVYVQQSNNSAAYNEYNLSSEISKSVNDKQGVIVSNNLQSNLLEKEGKKKEAVEKKIETLNYLNSTEREPVLDISDYDVSSDELLEEVEVAESDFNSTEEKPAPVNIAKESSKLNVEIGKSFLDLEKNDEAITYLKEAVTTSTKSGEIQTEKDAYGLLSEAYSRAGKFNEALETYKSYVGLVDSIYNLKENQILASLDLNNELSERLQRITSLEKDRTIQEQTIEILEAQRKAEVESNQSLKTLIYSLVIGLLLLLGLVYFMSRSAKQKRIANQLLALKNLRTQMNPHFIFNALNSVNNFISISDERSANRYLSEFSRLMRLVLENSEHDFIPLAKELEILELYVKLEHSRFSEKFDYQLIVDPNLNIEKYEIPPMIVQPYVENAVWHGLRYLNEKGNLMISIKEENDSLTIVIEDDGVGRKKSKELKTKNQQQTKSTAMKNIEDRLKIINGLNQWKVNVNVSNLKSDGTGTRVELKVRN